MVLKMVSDIEERKKKARRLLDELDKDLEATKKRYMELYRKKLSGLSLTEEEEEELIRISLELGKKIYEDIERKVNVLKRKGIEALKERLRELQEKEKLTDDEFLELSLIEDIIQEPPYRSVKIMRQIYEAYREVAKKHKIRASDLINIMLLYCAFNPNVSLSAIFFSDFKLKTKPAPKLYRIVKDLREEISKRYFF